MSPRKKALILAIALAVDAAVFTFKIHSELAQGQNVLWVAELWPPAAVATICLVALV
jgi:preprotein translocase subunit SecD